MKVRRQFKGRNTKDNKGYLNSNSENFTPFKEIDGGDITMQGVDIPLLAIPLDGDGKPMGMKFMEPGKEYDFKDAESTLEIPTYKKGGKSEWISKKISTLVKEGYPQEQAVAIAHSMFEKKMYGGEMKSYQNAGEVFDPFDNPMWDAVNDKLSLDRTVNQDVLKDRNAKLDAWKNGVNPNAQTPENQPFTYTGPTEEELKALELENAENDAMDISAFASGLPQGDTTFARTEGIDLEALNQENDIINDPVEPVMPGPVDQGEEDFQFFNQYQGVDIPTAAHIFGQNIGKGGDPFKAVASGAKLALGLGRNITSGMGFANANDFAINEYEDKKREALLNSDPTQYAQKGGAVADKNLTAQDRDTIREDVGFQFTDKYINDVFEKVMPKEAPKAYEPKLGRYEGLNYFINPTVKDDNITIETGQRFPEGAEQLNRYIGYIKEQNPGYNVDIKYNRKDSFQEGGVTTDELKKRRSAAVIAKRMSSVKSPEEFFKNFEDPDMVKYIKQYADMEPKKIESEANSIYKEILEKEGKWSAEPIRYAGQQVGSTIKDITNQIFNTSFEEGGDVGEALMTGNYRTGEQDNVNVEVEENEYMLTPDGELTKVLGKKHEQGGEKMNLPDGTRIVSDHLKLGANAKGLRDGFDIKVGAKDTYAKAIDKFYEKSGLQGIIDEEQEVIASIKEQKEKMAEEGRDTATRNINLEFLSSKINELNEAKQPLLNAAKLFFEKTYELQEKSKRKPADEEKFEIGGKVYNSDQIVKWGKQFDLSPEKALKAAKMMQGGGEFTDQGVAIGRGDQIPLGQHLDAATNLYGEITPEEFEKAKTINNWFDWTDFDITNPDDILRFQKEFNKKSKSAKIKEDGKFGIQTQSVFFPFERKAEIDSAGATLTNPEVLLEVPEVIKQKLADGEPLTAEEQGTVDAIEERNANSGVYIMPDQELLPPSGLIPSTKIERRYGRMEAERFTPDQQLSELNRSVDEAMSQLEALPSGQREAAIVQLQANKQQQADRIISETERLNKDLAQKEQSFNIRQGDREVDANAIDVLSFEQRSLGALANTEDDFRRYFNEGQRRNVERFKEIENLNLLNQMYENFDFTNNGVENTVGSGITEEDYMNMIRMQQAINSGGAVSTQSKQNGGTTKKKEEPKDKEKKVTRLYRRKGSRVRRELNFTTPKSTKLA